MPENSKLVQLYAELAAFTKPYCDRGEGACERMCNGSTRCCAPEYCEGSRQHTLKTYGIDLPPNGFHPTLAFMGISGCVLPAHFRPQCSAHACPLNLGGAPQEEIAHYYALRKEIERAELSEHRPALYVLPAQAAPQLGRKPPSSWTPALAH